MAGPILDKSRLWLQSDRGIRARLSGNLKNSVAQRGDISPLVVNQKVERGDALQTARLRFYPSIDVDREKLFAGFMEGDLDDATDRLMGLGFRNNPTAYVEVTEENGPDDGSFARVFVTETGARLDIPQLVARPTFFRRMKRQIHITVYDVGGRVEFLAHEEQSAWLQPMRHVLVNDAEASVGVRDFRDVWFDEFGEELSGKDEVMWPTTH